MALNWVQLDPEGGRRPLLLPGKSLAVSFTGSTDSLHSCVGERIIDTFKDATLHLSIPPTLSGPKQEIKAAAHMWLTNKRVSI
jgi:hypothetical protein